ncbi:MAG: baseplate assembly protein [Acidiphilium sp. 37-64-53]|uniref:phage baseplate assembly protein V n=2 Tax=Acidocellaceae TaxID=3385905 RepID=UPI000BC935FA|nr:phage baseplate assembly protein V [Acidiphilium sp.]OYW01419.1 MAG: baseplate assembly protein [Acidiphilium sp. 37-64-53]OZB26001.1 MAG: baseplate assembly protein [Acidiphilium sp. 34-64-41]HQT85931.1 phage baseplate assembly protein V [Acidiphilium rubrum]
MMDGFWNAVKARAAALDGMSGQARFGIVASFDASTYAARVMLQPENALSGWLPVLSSWIGAGWGMAAPLSPGDQVMVLAQEGDAEQAVVIGRVWSDAEPPPGAPVGEFWLVHQTGSFIKLKNDGTIALQASTVSIQGDLMVTGEISDLAGAHGTVDRLRQAYDRHVHADPQGGQTGVPSVVV